MRSLFLILILAIARPCEAQMRVDTVAEGGARVQVVRVDLARAEVRLLPRRRPL